jgi:hypothetical protein
MGGRGDRHTRKQEEEDGKEVVRRGGRAPSSGSHHERLRVKWGGAERGAHAFNSTACASVEIHHATASFVARSHTCARRR